MLDQSKLREFKPSFVTEMEDEDIADLFSKLDVEAAIEDCNFNKAVGIDWFSGKTIKRNPHGLNSLSSD